MSIPNNYTAASSNIPFCGMSGMLFIMKCRQSWMCTHLEWFCSRSSLENRPFYLLGRQLRLNPLRAGHLSIWLITVSRLILAFICWFQLPSLLRTRTVKVHSVTLDIFSAPQLLIQEPTNNHAQAVLLSCTAVFTGSRRSKWSSLPSQICGPCSKWWLSRRLDVEGKKLWYQ